MDETENTERLAREYFARMGSGDPRGALALFSEDATYRVMGTTPLSQPAKGRREIIDRVFVPFTSRLKDGQITLTIDEIIAQGGKAVVIAHSEAAGLTGLPYHNEYAIVITAADGKITSFREYLDTALVETAIFGKTLA